MPRQSKKTRRTSKARKSPEPIKNIAPGFDMSDPDESQAPTLAANLPADESRPRNAKGHKPTCKCLLCSRIQARIERGAEKWETARMKSAARTAIKKAAVTSTNPREASVQSAIVTQIARGEKPNVAEALKIAGVDPSHKELRRAANVSIITALDSAGITDERLVSKANELLEAKHTKFFADHGMVVDEREVTDNKIQHDTWRDLMMVRGHLRTDEAPAIGGLMIINAINPIQEGHDINCQCDECKAIWESRAAESLATQRKREAQKIIDVAPELVEDSIH